MANKKYCRPRMTVEARDAINRMCKAQMDEGLFVNDRSDAIVCLETDINQLHSEIKDKTKKLDKTEMERDCADIELEFTRKKVVKARKWIIYCLTSVFANLAMLTYIAISEGWFG